MSTDTQKPTESVLSPEEAAAFRERQAAWLKSVSVVSEFTPEQVTLLKNTVAKNATDQELRLFATVCARTRLDPFSKQIHFVKRYDSQANDGEGGYVGAFQVGIDGFRVIAERNGNYAGKVSEEWCGTDGKWLDIWTSKEPPFAARVTVVRRDWPNPVSAIARWDAYKQTKRGGDLTRMWETRGPEQLAKCAEAACLRIVAPNDLGALYTPEELGEEDQVERPLRIVDAATALAEKNATAAADRAAVGAALAGPEPSGASVVDESGTADGASDDSSAPPPVGSEAPAPAPPTAEPDYEAEAKKVMAGLGHSFAGRGAAAAWKRCRDNLVAWGVKGGLAPSGEVVDDKAVWGLATLYEKHKREAQGGEVATEEAAAGTEPAPSTEVSGGAPEFSERAFIDLCGRASRAFDGKRPFCMPHDGAVWFVDANILWALGTNDSIEVCADNAGLLVEAEKHVNEAIRHAQRNIKQAPRGPAPL